MRLVVFSLFMSYVSGVWCWGVSYERWDLKQMRFVFNRQATSFDKYIKYFYRPFHFRCSKRLTSMRSINSLFNSIISTSVYPTLVPSP